MKISIEIFSLSYIFKPGKMLFLSQFYTYLTPRRIIFVTIVCERILIHTMTSQLLINLLTEFMIKLRSLLMSTGLDENQLSRNYVWLLRYYVHRNLTI